jgi:hypothetical protein
MINAKVRVPSLAFILAAAFLAATSASSAASEFTEACLKAQIFTQKDCTCIDGKAGDADRKDMIVWLTADDVKKQGGQVSEAEMEKGMAVMGKYGEQCDKQ